MPLLISVMIMHEHFKNNLEWTRFYETLFILNQKLFIERKLNAINLEQDSKIIFPFENHGPIVINNTLKEIKTFIKQKLGSLVIIKLSLGNFP